MKAEAVVAYCWDHAAKEFRVLMCGAARVDLKHGLNRWAVHPPEVRAALAAKIREQIRARDEAEREAAKQARGAA